jgi:hypothetical protein
MDRQFQPSTLHDLQADAATAALAAEKSAREAANAKVADLEAKIADIQVCHK